MLFRKGVYAVDTLYSIMPECLWDREYYVCYVMLKKRALIKNEKEGDTRPTQTTEGILINSQFHVYLLNSKLNHFKVHVTL